ncbi:MAG: 3,4-dihydroxy-2-butanone-4-phosphate synthase, partial [Actinomycetota bacterium]
MAFASVEEAAAALAAGKIVVVVDDEARENEGDFVMAGEKATPEAINFMAREAGVPLTVPMTKNRLEALGVPMMVAENTSPQGTAFTVSVDLMIPGHTGSSAHDRAATIRALADPATQPGHLARPGHVFPLRAAEGGVLRRAGHTEAAIDLANLAGFEPVAVLGEIMDREGQMARLPYLQDLAREHGLKILTIKDLIAYRRQREKLVERVATARIPTPYGDFIGHAYKAVIEGGDYVAFVKGEVAGE